MSKAKEGVSWTGFQITVGGLLGFVTLVLTVLATAFFFIVGGIRDDVADLRKVGRDTNDKIAALSRDIGELSGSFKQFTQDQRTAPRRP